MATRSPRGSSSKSASKTTKTAKRAPSTTTKKRAPAKRPAPTPVKFTPDEKSRLRAVKVAQAALDKKAEDVVLIDVRGLTSIADFFVVMSGSGARQLGAIAEAIEGELKKDNVRPLSTEGQQGGNWVLLDFGDVVAHIFESEVRGFYDLEGLWADAPRERINA